MQLFESIEKGIDKRQFINIEPYLPLAPAAFRPNYLSEHRSRYAGIYKYNFPVFVWIRISHVWGILYRTVSNMFKTTRVCKPTNETNRNEKKKKTYYPKPVSVQAKNKIT